MPRLIPLKKSQAENDSYVGYSGEIVSIPNVGVAVHNNITPGGVLLTPQEELNRNGADNIVRNSNFQFTQNGNTFLGNSGNVYTLDGWFVQHGGGSTSNVAQVTGWDATIKQNSFLRCTTFTGGASNSFSLISQRYARLRRYAGREMTISYWVKCGSSISVSGECGLTFADVGTSNRSTLINRVTLQAGVWQKVEQTFTVPSISASDVIDDTQDHMYVYFWLEAGDDYNDRTGGLLPSSASFDIANVKIEYGTQATGYSTASYREEERKVHEYFEKNAQLRFFSPTGTTAHTSTCHADIRFANPKWNTTPDVTYTTDFATGVSVYRKDQSGFVLLATANDAVSGARMLTFTADSEISP